MNLEYQFSNLLGLNLDDLYKNSLTNLYFKNQNLEKIGNRYYITNKYQGIGFVFDEEKKMTSIHFHRGGVDGYETYSDSLPCEISFKDNPESIHKKTNLDFLSGGGEVLPILGKTNYWRKYQYSNCYLRIEFDKNNLVTLVSLGSSN